MKKNDYLFYSDYIKNKKIFDKKILISKTKNSYLIGPMINNNFDNESFYKRLISNSVYPLKIYRKMFNNKCLKLINKYIKMLSDNEIIEVYYNNDIIKHKIIKLPGEQ